MLRTFALLVTLLPLCHCLLGIGRLQSVAVKGKLVCNNIPASKVKVKLYEKEVFIDKKMDETRTDLDGQFRLSGSKREITTIDPKVNIYHKCGYSGPCYKKLSITIPDQFITRGRYPQRTYDIGTLNLANKFKGQTTDCFN